MNEIENVINNTLEETSSKGYFKTFFVGFSIGFLLFGLHALKEIIFYDMSQINALLFSVTMGFFTGISSSLLKLSSRMSKIKKWLIVILGCIIITFLSLGIFYWIITLNDS